jgi:hypothetical protein
VTEVDDADQPAQVFCESCSDNYCEVCFAAQHRKGTRKRARFEAFDVATGEERSKRTAMLKTEEDDEDSVSSLNLSVSFLT